MVQPTLKVHAGIGVAWLYGVAAMIGLAGGIFYFPVAALVTDAGWTQRAVADDWQIVIAGATLLQWDWVDSFLTELAQLVVGTVVPPVVGFETGIYAAVAASFGCHVGSRSQFGPAKAGPLAVGTYLAFVGLCFSALTGSLFVLLWVMFLSGIGLTALFLSKNYRCCLSAVKDRRKVLQGVCVSAGRTAAGAATGFVYGKIGSTTQTDRIYGCGRRLKCNALFDLQRRGSPVDADFLAESRNAPPLLWSEIAVLLHP